MLSRLRANSGHTIFTNTWPPASANGHAHVHGERPLVERSPNDPFDDSARESANTNTRAWPNAVSVSIDILKDIRPLNSRAISGLCLQYCNWSSQQVDWTASAQHSPEQILILSNIQLVAVEEH